MNVAHILGLLAFGHAGIAMTLGAQAPARPDPQPAARSFVMLLADGKYAAAEATLDTTMLRVMPAERLRGAWEAVVTQAGAFRGITGTALTTTGPYRKVTVTSAFERVSIDVQVVYDAADKVAGLFMVPTPAAWQPAAYVRSDAFHAEEVTVGHGALSLPGTLTIPNGKGPFPALVLVHGSGPNDRDESVGGVRVFRDLAEGLASQGVAVLRYEKRTRAHPASFIGTFTVNEETVDDAVMAVELLRARPELAGNRVYVLGHSLGGMLAPRIARRDSAVAGLVIMAGTTRPLEDVILEQTTYLATLPGNDTPAAREQFAALRAAAARVRALTPADSASTSPVMGAPAAYWLDLRAYHPAETAGALRVPMLVLQGERDYQVTMADFDGWRRTLAGRANVTLKTYPGLNHLFVSGTGPSMPAEYAATAHVAPGVVDDIARWITTRR